MERSSRKLIAPTPQSEHSRQIFKNNLHGQSAWDRHKSYVARYLQVYERDGGKARQDRLDSTARNDWDVLKERHRFLRDEEEMGQQSDPGAEYENEVARRYYNHLFKEYAIADMKHYKTGNLALRWRSEDDVVDGIGQFSECYFQSYNKYVSTELILACANTRCEHHRQLQSLSVQLTPYEVNFAYEEPDTKPNNGSVMKNALVKIVLCHRCCRKLKYKSDRDKSRRSASPVRKRSAR